MSVVLEKQTKIVYHLRMKINSILAVTPEEASDIQYLWDETDMTSEEIAEAGPYGDSTSHFPLEVVWDVLGGGYSEEDYENHKAHVAHYESN